MFQVFEVYNCRSRRRSAFSGMLENKWLLVSVVISVGTHILVIYMPMLQEAFHTVALSFADWLIATAVAATLLAGMELAKFFLRAHDRHAHQATPQAHGAP
jgi:Ca2+-transporting ATPase